MPSTISPPPSTVSAPDSVASPTKITFRAVLLSLFLAAMWGYVVPIVDFKFTNTFLGAAHLPAGAIAVLMALLLVVNPLLKSLPGRLALRKNEILVVFISCLFSCLIAGRGGENLFVPSVLASFYLATRENQWLSILEPYLKPWFTPALENPEVVQGFYAGGGQIPWGAWAIPLLAWTSVIFALYTMLGCFAVILRAQWADREALSFPLLKLPIEMTHDADEPAKFGAFFRSRLMWVGFGAAVFVQGLNGLSLYFPDVPRIAMGLPLGQFFTEAPWNQLGATRLDIWPVVIGISFLLTSEISFSLWFFLFFAKAQLVAAYMLGFQPNMLPDPVWTRGFSKGFVAYQQFGAVLAYALVVLWIGREHYFYVFRRAFRLEKARPSERDEPLSYPAAFWGFAFSSAFILAWMVAAGVRLDIAAILLATYLLIAVVLTRLVVEAGVLLVNVGWMPLGPLSGLLGNAIPTSSAVPAAFIGTALMTEMRGFLLPSFVQSFKLAKDNGIPLRPLLALIAGVIVVTFGVSIWSILRLGHSDVGGLQLQHWWSQGTGALQPVRTAEYFSRGIQESLATNWFWLFVGMSFTILLMNARARFAWFPLHPLGYVICTPFAILTLWFSVFLGWLCKTLIMRFGGTPAYRAAIPLFLGLALGDVAMMIFWVAIDGWQGRMGHYLMPN